jgi:hypothetical protein
VISFDRAGRCHENRDGRDKPGHDVFFKQLREDGNILTWLIFCYAK